jgi:hypothetical protein
MPISAGFHCSRANVLRHITFRRLSLFRLLNLDALTSLIHELLSEVIFSTLTAIIAGMT